MPFTPTQEEKASALSDVAYEVEQILYDLNSLKRLDNPTSTNQLEVNAHLEALLLHTRVLLDFFEHPTREQDDVLATDYEFSARDIGIDGKFRGRLNKDLAHLTYSRQKRLGDAKSWNIAELLSPLLERFSEFADHVVATWLDFLLPHQRTRWERLATCLEGVEWGECVDFGS
jgi:hypothetical protein